MKFKVLFLFLLFLTSCAHYTKTEKVLFTGMVVAQAADAYTTSRVLSNGGYEQNPLLGRHPSDGELALWTAGNTALMMVLGEVFPEYRKYIFGGSMVIHGGCAMWNIGQF